ncbi:MAG: tripartite tricarboxylate transporter substrate binding protein [Betaproteobacteria bacterium]|nr:tripartite tricarboxylate transporter substrate binding protein [Betaproteobacteria bacterium]
MDMRRYGPLVIPVLIMLATCCNPAQSSDPHPNRPIRLIVPNAPGGNADIIGRLIGRHLSENLGQQVVIDNRPGANGIIGSDLAAKAIPDGYTILVVASQHGTNPTLVKRMPYDTERDFAPISRIGSTPLILTAHRGLSITTVRELIGVAKAKPGQLNYSSTGDGSPANLAGALLGFMTGIKLVNVPYKGTAQATTAVIAGEVELGFPSITSVLPYVKMGKLNALGITGLKRSPLAPDVPTLSETGVAGYEYTIWNGILAPAATPLAIITRLNSEIVRILSSPETSERFSGMGVEVVYGRPEEFRAFIRSEIKKWSEVIRKSGIRLEP